MNPLIKKLKHLQNVTPRSDWKSEARAHLLSEISQSKAAQAPQATFFGRQLDLLKSAFSFILPSHQTLHMLKPAGALFSLSLLVLSSGIFTVSASQSTLPGDALYTVKLATERVQSALTTKEPEKAKLEIAFAGKRINELEQIVSDPVVPEQEKQEQVEVVITKFQENITKAQATLDGIKDSDEVHETVALAAVIDENITGYKETLEEVEKVAPDQVKGTVKDAATDAGEKGDAALTVLVEKHEKDSSTTDSITLAEKVDNRLFELEKMIGSVSAEIDFLLMTTSTDVFIEDTSSEQETASSTEQILLLQKTRVGETAESIESINVLIEKEEFTKALTAVKEAKTVVKEIEATVEALKAVHEEGVVPEEPVEKDEESDENATSTEQVSEENQAEPQESEKTETGAEGIEISVSDEGESQESDGITATEAEEDTTV